jgi:hypothetical protein
MQSLANSGVFLVLLIAGIVVVYALPTIIGLIREVDGLGLVVLLNLIGWVAWPAALILAFGPRRLPPSPLPPYPPLVLVHSPVVIVYPQQWPLGGPADDCGAAYGLPSEATDHVPYRPAR